MKKIVFVVLALSVILLIGSLFSMMVANRPIDIKKIGATVNITSSNKVGFDANKSLLAFGLVPMGSSSSRKLKLSNDYSFPIRVELSSEGDISRLLRYQESYYLNPNESIHLPVQAVGDSEGYYSGYVSVLIYPN